MPDAPPTGPAPTFLATRQTVRAFFALVASWCCAWGRSLDSHKTECRCSRTRDNQPAGPLATASIKVGQLLRTLAPKATSALVDLTDLAYVCAVFAGEREIDSDDDTGPFDSETLGSADVVLRMALKEAVAGDLAASGWEHVRDGQSAALYRVTFPPVPSH